MKKAVTFLALSMLFLFGTGNADYNDGPAGVTKLKSTIKSATNELERYGFTLFSDLNKKIGDQKKSALTTLDSIINPALDSVRAAIFVAKENGKNAENCYELARLELKQSWYIDANMELDRCIENVNTTVKPIKSNITEEVAIGDRLIKYIDHINVNCLTFVHINYQKCIEEKMPRVSLTVKDFETSVNELQKTADSLSSSAITSAFNCNQESIDKVRQAAEDVRISSKKCIANS